MYFPVQGSTIVALKADAGTELWKFDLKTIPDIGAEPFGRRPRDLILARHRAGCAAHRHRDDERIPRPARREDRHADSRPRRASSISRPASWRSSAATTRRNMPPALYRNLAIIAGRTGEQGRYGIPGDPRAFDLLTGKEVWRFHVVPHPGEENFGTWGLNGWQDRRGPGVWMPMTVDPVNDLVFIALGNATDQNYGNNRPGRESLRDVAARAPGVDRKTQVALPDDAPRHLRLGPRRRRRRSSRRRRTARRVPAVAQMTKQGLLFMFHRLTGEPLFGVEERPVPRFDAPGDQAWPTQPFPVKPAGLTRDGMTRKEVSKISPEAEKYCTELFDKSVNMGPYTPYGMVPSLVFPGFGGRRRVGRRRRQSGARSRLREHAASRRHRAVAAQHVVRRAAVVREAEGADQLLRRSAGLSLQRAALVRAHRGEHEHR